MRAALGCFLAVAALTLGSSRASAETVASTQLTDVITSKGVGSINLLKNATPSQLEAFRQEGAGSLLFAVDVNESASGTEKAACQGITLDSVELTVVKAGVQQKFSSFSSRTQALVAAAGSTTRALHYTLLGDTGSGRITGSPIRGKFDSTLSVPVNVDLSQVTSAVLSVKLLQTNVSMGDPEAFYDFSNGYEDMALLTAADASWLDVLAPGVPEAPAVVQSAPPADLTVNGWASYPTANSYYTVGYEDLFPNRGDYDFNDLVVAYRVDVGTNAAGEVVRLKGTAFLVGRGAGFTHDWTLRIRIDSGASGNITTQVTDPKTFAVKAAVTPFSGNVDIAAFKGTWQLMPPPSGWDFTNTEAGSPFDQSPRVDFTVGFAAPVPAAKVQGAPFDPFLYVINTGYEVHMQGEPPSVGSKNAAQGYTSSVDANGYPFAMLVPNDWPFPLERVDLGLAYPDIASFVASSGTAAKNWYEKPSPGKVRAYSAGGWEWAPPPK